MKNVYIFGEIIMYREQKGTYDFFIFTAFSLSVVKITEFIPE